MWVKPAAAKNSGSISSTIYFVGTTPWDRAEGRIESSERKMEAHSVKYPSVSALGFSQSIGGHGIRSGE
jgi:hypothetical protein